MHERHDLHLPVLGLGGSLSFASRASSCFFRCASRMASISAHRLLKAEETFFWPTASCLPMASRDFSNRSSRCISATCLCATP